MTPSRKRSIVLEQLGQLDKNEVFSVGLKEVRESFFARFPEAQWIDEALQGNDNPTPSFFLASLNSDADLRGSGMVLVRLGVKLERRFGIHGEVAAYFTPWGDFQRRSFNAISMRTEALSRELQSAALGSERFTPSNRVALLVSGDPLVEQKITEWQADSRSPLTVVPIIVREHATKEIRSSIINGLRSRLGDRDLYRNQNPVTGEDFFGRADLLRALCASVLGDENVAILGLRRSGKTSVIKELKRQVLPRRVVIVIADFQMLEESSIDQLAASIASSLLEELKIARSEGLDAWVGNEAEQEWRGITLAALSDRLKRVASRNPSLRIVIAVDEIEGAVAIAQQNPEAIKTLLGSLRSAAQARDNVSLLFSGVANRMFQSSTLGASKIVDNPIFGQVSSVYLTPFELRETAALLRGLGRPMLLDWSDGAVGRVHDLTGGYPFFVRDLASHVRRQVTSSSEDQAADIVKISSAQVDSLAPAWLEQAGETWLGMLQALDMHYPAAAMLLSHELTETDVSDWVAGDAEAAVAARDLERLGFLEFSGPTVRFTSALRSLHALVVDKTPHISSAQEDYGQDVILALIRGGESHTVEFKETSRINTHTHKQDGRMEDVVVKTVAGFLNSEGGSLLVGVSDSGEVRGIDPDLALFGGSADRFERWILGDLLCRRIDLQTVTDNVSISFLPFRGKLILKVSVAKCAEVCWVDDEKLFRRSGNQTIEVRSGREIARFLGQRSRKMDD